MVNPATLTTFMVLMVRDSLAGSFPEDVLRHYKGGESISQSINTTSVVESGMSIRPDNIEARVDLGDSQRM
jgi:hypothetical protein